MCIQSAVEMKTLIYRVVFEFIWMPCYRASDLEIVGKLLSWQLNPNSCSKRTFNILHYKSQERIECMLNRKCHAFRGTGLFVVLNILENFSWISFTVSFNTVLRSCTNVLISWSLVTLTQRFIAPALGGVAYVQLCWLNCSSFFLPYCCVTLCSLYCWLPLSGLIPEKM